MYRYPEPGIDDRWLLSIVPGIIEYVVLPSFLLVLYGRACRLIVRVALGVSLVAGNGVAVRR